MDAVAAAVAWPLTQLLRWGGQWRHQAPPSGDVDALPDEAVAAILARLPADAVGALSLASRSWRAAVSRALEDLRPVALWPPPASITNAAVSPFGGVARLVLLPRWQPPWSPSSSAAPVPPPLVGGREGLSPLLRALPLLRECALDLRGTPGALSPQTPWPRGLTALTLFSARLDDVAAVDASPALRQGLRALSLLPLAVPEATRPAASTTWTVHQENGQWIFSEAAPTAPSPPPLEGFTALRELSLAAPGNVRWRVCRETVARLTSLSLRVSGAPAGCVLSLQPRPPPRRGPPTAQGEEDDATLLLSVAAPAADLLRPRALADDGGGGAWPNLRRLEVPDDGFCPADAPPALRPLLFSEAFPNLEALSVPTTPGRAPALAAGLSGLKGLRRLVIRRVTYYAARFHPSRAAAIQAHLQLEEEAFAAAAAAYRGDDAAGSSTMARALALGGLAPLARTLLAGDGSSLELVVGLNAACDSWPGDPAWAALEGRALAAAFGGPADAVGGAPHEWASSALTHPPLVEVGGGGGDEERAPRPPWAATGDEGEEEGDGGWVPPALVADPGRVRAPWPVPGLPQLRAWGAGASGGVSADKVAVLTAADGSGSLVIASPRPGVPIARAMSEEKLQAAERALFSFSVPSNSPRRGEAERAGWQPDPRAADTRDANGAVPPLPDFLRSANHVLTRLRLLPPAALHGGLRRLELDALEFLAASSSTARHGQETPPPPPPPLLCALPCLRVLHLRSVVFAFAEGEAAAAAVRAQASKVWEVLSGGIASKPLEAAASDAPAGAPEGLGGGGGGTGGGLIASPSRRFLSSSVGAGLAEAVALAAATGPAADVASSTASAPAATTGCSRSFPPLVWLRLQGFPNAGSSPASLRAIARYGRTLRALDVVEAERAPVAAPFVELLSRRCPRVRYLSIESTALPAGWLSEVAALLSRPAAHVASASWVVHVLSALPGLPAAIALVGGLAAAAVRQAPRLLEMALLAHLAALLAALVWVVGAAHVWALAAAEAVARRGLLAAPGAALAGRLRFLSLRGCTAEDPQASVAGGAWADGGGGVGGGGGLGGAGGAGGAGGSGSSALLTLARACPRLRFLDLLYCNASAAEIAQLLRAGGGGADEQRTTPLWRRWWRRRGTAGGLSSSLAYVNSAHRPPRWTPPQGPPALVSAPDGLAATVLEREVWLDETTGGFVC